MEKLKQSKLYGLHTSEQISGLLDFCRCKFVDLQPNSHSTTSIDIYLKRLKLCSEQSCVPNHNEKFLQYFGSGTNDSRGNGRNIISSVTPKLDEDVHEHIEKISGQLHAQIKAIASDFDSDITASSSGNDSLDEETPLPMDAVEERSKKIPFNEVSYTDVAEENRKKCLQMERRIDRLTRRLKLKQSKLYGLHTSEQISGLLDFCRCKFVDLQSNSHSATSIEVYLKRLKRCSEQSCVPNNNEKSLQYFGSGTKDYRGNGRNMISSVAPKLDEDVHEHIEKISGQLHAQIKAIANDFDSDITASSSGNDSLDEETSLSMDAVEERSKKIPLSKRAIWRWLRNRASIAYRLSWLQSHMSALEYKIHHYTEIYKKLRTTKGQMILQNGSESNGRCWTATTTATTKNTINSHVVLNGFHGSLPTVDGIPTHTKTENDKEENTTTVFSSHESEETCSRTCPLLKGKFRKRNLVRLDTLQPVNAFNSTNSKYASVRCDCVAPLTCILCCSRGPGVDLSNQRIYANLLSVQSKIALLEPTYHPVLSFPSDVSVSTHISALLNNDDVLDICRNRTAAQMSIKRHYTNYKTTEEIRRANAEGAEYKRRKKYVRRQTNNSQASYGRSQLLGKQRHSKLDKTLSFRKRRRKRLRTKRPSEKDNGLNESPDEGLYYKKDDVYNSQPGSPHSSHSSTVKDPIRRKRGQSYDIDNFIIPPNSTPALVVSKPQYKEILIPTWRIVEDKNPDPTKIDRVALPPHILEDLNDEKVTKLHEILEQNECKKFRTNSSRDKIGHTRNRKRADSCPETSEANTPERVASPVTLNNDGNDGTVVFNINSAITNSVISSNQLPTSVNKAKIPTLNKIKTNLECDNSSVVESPSVETPYELREFPLSEEVYKDMLISQHEKCEDTEQEVDHPNDTKPPENENRVQSPFTETTDSISEDPDDPDWMLHGDEIDKNQNC